MILWLKIISFTATNAKPLIESTEITFLMNYMLILCRGMEVADFSLKNLSQMQPKKNAMHSNVPYSYVLSACVYGFTSCRFTL